MNTNMNRNVKKKIGNQRSLMLVGATDVSDFSSGAVYMTNFKPMEQRNFPLCEFCVAALGPARDHLDRFSRG